MIGQFGVLRELKELPPLLGNKLYLEGRLDIGAYQRVDTDLGKQAEYRIPGDVSAGLLVNTIFGPVVLGGAVGDAGHRRFFFSVGRVF